MRTSDTNLLLRDDTFFGVCEGLGEDFGIPSNLFRVGFAFLLFFSPAAAIGGYAALGLLIGFTRLVAPNPKPAAGGREASPAIPAHEGDNENRAEDEPLSVAA